MSETDAPRWARVWEAVVPSNQTIITGLFGIWVLTGAFVICSLLFGSIAGAVLHGSTAPAWSLSKTIWVGAPITLVIAAFAAANWYAHTRAKDGGSND